MSVHAYPLSSSCPYMLSILYTPFCLQPVGTFIYSANMLDLSRSDGSTNTDKSLL